MERHADAEPADATGRLGTALLDALVQDPWRDVATEEMRLLAVMMSMRSRTGSQLFQDLWVLYETGMATGGYFVEFGALDGIEMSNTMLLEQEFGWTGLLAEPNPLAAVQCRANRSAMVDSRCVWENSGGEVELDVSDYAAVSTVASGATADSWTNYRRNNSVSTVAVPTITLNDLLEDHRVPREFDFMSVDTEGTELRILRDHDFDAHRPRLLAVEHGYNTDREALEELIVSNGYEIRFPTFSRWDTWYRDARRRSD